MLSQKRVAFGLAWLVFLLSMLYLAQTRRTVVLEPSKQTEETTQSEFAVDAARLLQDVETQLSFGPRYSGSTGHDTLLAWLFSTLSTPLFKVETQAWTYEQSDQAQLTFTNVIARFAPEKSARVILGAHYDSRAHADQDWAFPDSPVPGANDGASGVAVLQEVARVLAQADTKPRVGVDLVFFDAEEGDPMLPEAGNPWKPFGSEYFASHLPDFYSGEFPQAALVVDMVCDADLEFLIEEHSYRDAKANTERVWLLGQARYPDIFVNELGAVIYDDHTALNIAGIPSTLLIDFTYPYWHTVRDTIDKCSTDSLEKVTQVVLDYLYSF